MLAEKPRLVAAIALANKMARSVWAMLEPRAKTIEDQRWRRPDRQALNAGASAMTEVEER
jgi:hypothetical protein